MILGNKRVSVVKLNANITVTDEYLGVKPPLVTDALPCSNSGVGIWPESSCPSKIP